MTTSPLLRRTVCYVLLLLLTPMLVFGQTSGTAAGKKKKSENPFTAVAAVREYPFVPLAKDQPYGDPSLPPEERAAAVVKAMTLEEKLNSVGGFQQFYSPRIERLGIRPLYFSDASQGVHIRENLNTGLEKSTAFPCTLALAATWNPELAGLYAKSIGEECRAGDIAVLLGPGMNIYRDSECGRNFEDMGEDPLLAGRMVAASAPIWASGSVTRNVAPEPGPSLAAWMRPPWSVTIRCTIESPRPVPCPVFRLVKNGSKRCSCTSSVIPQPSSVNVSTASPPERFAATRTFPFSSIESRALTSRLSKTCWRWIRSPRIGGRSAAAEQVSVTCRTAASA